jgi:hypothetical protein
MTRWIVCAACGVLIVAMAGWGPARAPLPKPAEESGESSDFVARRQAWIESLHAHAAGVDWRSMDAASRARLREQREIAATNTSAPIPLSAPPAGTWRERGARNQAGRVSDVDYDATTDRLTVFSHGGQLWRTLRASLAWQPLNDARQFKPNYSMQHFARLAGAPERWLAADDTLHGLYYSDNQGATWTGATGFVPANWVETTYLAARDISGNQVYAIVVDYNFSSTAYQARLLVSANRGASYADLGFLGTDSVALFAPQGSSLVYVLIGSVLKRIETNNTLTTIGTISGTPVQAAGEKIGLAGGTATGTGIPFLFAFFETAGPTTQVFRSLDAGATWQARGSVPATGNIRVAAGASLHNSNLVFYGAVNLYRSGDGGQTFLPVNDWTEYYTNVAAKLHADISFVRSFADALGNEVFFVGTDGGVFQSTDGLLTVANLNLNSMRQGQYYDSYTGRNPPYAISIGAQDQGYQRNSRPPSGIAAYAQVISGDYAHLASSDGGATVWMNYPGFTQIDPTPAAGGVVLPAWDFTSDGNLQNMLFLPPLLADPANAHGAWLAGGATTGGVNHVMHLSWNGAVQYTGAISFAEGSFDFGGNITALAYSPQSPTTLFAMANTPSSTNARFFRTTTPAAGWTQTVTTLPQGQFFYGQTILPDPSRPQVIYICGSGYSGPGVYVSVNNGTSFVAMNTGLPSTLVYSLAISPDGANLFAATEVGPYYFDRATSTWLDIGAGAPDSTYWNVDYVPALHVARFSTYGRGLWDFDLGGGDLIFRDSFD